MPTLPMPACRYPGCPNLQARDGRGYCEAHRAEADLRDRRGRWRASWRQRGYDRQYEKARAWVLAHEPLCGRCLAEGKAVEATQTHHRVPLAEGGTNDVTNLEPLCAWHHEQEHAARRRQEHE